MRDFQMIPESPKTPPRVLDRIRKILARASSTNPHEAASAAALAQRLMLEHRLTMEDVGEDVELDAISEISLGSDGMAAPWRFALVTAIARAFLCEAIGLRQRQGPRRRVKIVGRKSEAEAALAVYRHVASEIERMADEEMSDPFVISVEATSLGLPGGFDARSYKDSFRRGAVRAVAERLKDELRHFARRSDRALVIATRGRDEVTSYLSRKYGESRVSGSKLGKEAADEMGLYRGYARGQDIELGRRDAGDGETPSLAAGETEKKP
jgi:hypothetical protein